MSNVVIRFGRKDDLIRTLELIKELAEFENALHEVYNTLEMMEEDGFGENSVFHFFVAEEGNEIHGIALYYYRYSTWKGRRLYLEDIVVTKNQRGKGIGKLLFDACMRQTLRDNCTGMMWQVLDWNKNAIEFYSKYNTRFDNEWINCHMEANQISELLIKP
jgi:GNAT superfamily N-acetyltransferase